MSSRATDLIPEPIRENIARNGLPDAVYAVAGVVDLAQSEVKGLPDRLEEIPSVLSAAPNAVLSQIGDQVNSVIELASGHANSAATLATEQADTAVSLASGQVTTARSIGAQVGGTVISVYSTLVQRGEQRVVAETAERAVRRRVSRVEDSVAPRAARAAVRIQDRRRRWRQSERLQGFLETAKQTQQAAKRSMEKFEEINAPVLADPE